MPIDLTKYRIRGAHNRAIEVLTPAKEDKSYLTQRKRFSKACDKWVQEIQNGKVRGVRGSAASFLDNPSRRWTALGNDSQLVTVPKSGTTPIDADLIYIGTATDTMKFLRDVKAAADEGQFDDTFKKLAAHAVETPSRRRRGPRKAN